MPGRPGLAPRTGHPLESVPPTGTGARGVAAGAGSPVSSQVMAPARLRSCRPCFKYARSAWQWRHLRCGDFARVAAEADELDGSEQHSGAVGGCLRGLASSADCAAPHRQTETWGRRSRRSRGARPVRRTVARRRLRRKSKWASRRWTAKDAAADGHIQVCCAHMTGTKREQVAVATGRGSRFRNLQCRQRR